MDQEKKVIEKVLNLMLRKCEEVKSEYGGYVCISLIYPAGTIDGYRTGFEAGVREGMTRLIVAVAEEYNRLVDRDVTIYSGIALNEHEMARDSGYMNGYSDRIIRYVRPEMETKIMVDWEHRSLWVDGLKYFQEYKNEHNDKAIPPATGGA